MGQTMAQTTIQAMDPVMVMATETGMATATATGMIRHQTFLRARIRALFNQELGSFKPIPILKSLLRCSVVQRTFLSRCRVVTLPSISIWTVQRLTGSSFISQVRKTRSGSRIRMHALAFVQEKSVAVTIGSSWKTLPPDPWWSLGT